MNGDMRNICSINLMNISNSGSLNSAAGTDELILQIIPLLSQKTNFKVEITKSGGGVVTSGSIAEKDGWITYIVPSAYYAKVGTMKLRLIAEEETSDYVLFSVPADIEGDVQVKWDEASGQFVIDSIGKQLGAIDYVIEQGTVEDDEGTTWAWRKWANGLLEAWTDEINTKVRNLTSTYGNSYYNEVQLNIPVTITEIKNIVSQIVAGNETGLYAISIRNYKRYTDRIWIRLYIYSQRQEEEKELAINMQIKARWK